MSIKSIVKQESDSSVVDYPALAIFPEVDSLCGMVIVLMTGPRCGTVVYTEDRRYKVGYHSVDWGASWKLFEGRVTLEGGETKCQ